MMMRTTGRMNGGTRNVRATKDMGMPLDLYVIRRRVGGDDHQRREQGDNRCIRNCTCLHYTRRDPETGRTSKRVRWEHRHRTQAGRLHRPPGPKWEETRVLRERSWGEINTITKDDFKTNYARNWMFKNTDPLYWRPPAGESIADVAEPRAQPAHVPEPAMRNPW